MDLLNLTPEPRSQHGFLRTSCDCEMCSVHCRHVPGALDPSDLEKLCPEGEDVFLWAEEHLRAMVHKSYPLLVPRQQQNGHCHWLVNGLCMVHENSPYGCAFFDSHQSKEEADQRSKPSIAARHESAKNEDLYYRVWVHLKEKNLIGNMVDRAALKADMTRIQRKLRRRWGLLS